MAEVTPAKATSENKFQYVAMAVNILLFAAGVIVPLLTTIPAWLAMAMSALGMVSQQMAAAGYTKWRTKLKIETASK